MSRRRTVAIVGGSGYGGAECLRWLLPHPGFEVVAATSRRHAGRPVAEVHGNLLGFTDLRFSDTAAADLALGVDALVLALPHGEPLHQVPAILAVDETVRIVDLSGDFRLSDPEVYRRFYGRPHLAAELLDTFAYGLTETNRAAIDAARRIANPGCFATGAALALAPLAEAGLLDADVVVSAATGSSGSGVDAKSTTHHPERTGDFRAYRVLRHQHAPEIEAELARRGASDARIRMVPHSAPLARGIFTTAVARLPDGAPEERVREIYERCCSEEPFLRLREGTPRLAEVAGTNFCDLAVHVDDGTVVVLSAIDNLGKGMAGQAVQNLNRLFGYEETEGLLVPGGRP
jgi:N-acetyl-gamma-glutamyl-phosphate reductase